MEVRSRTSTSPATPNRPARPAAASVPRRSGSRRSRSTAMDRSRRQPRRPDSLNTNPRPSPTHSTGSSRTATPSRERGARKLPIAIAARAMTARPAMSPSPRRSNAGQSDQNTPTASPGSYTGFTESSDSSSVYFYVAPDGGSIEDVDIPGEPHRPATRPASASNPRRSGSHRSRSTATGRSRRRPRRPDSLNTSPRPSPTPSTATSTGPPERPRAG